MHGLVNETRFPQNRTRIMKADPKQRRRGRPPKSEIPKSELLLRAALTIFAEEGFSAASMRRIATEARTDVALITHSFGSKADLWKAVIDQLADRLQKAMTAVDIDEDETLSASERLRRTMVCVVDIMADTPHIAQFLMKEISHTGDKFDYIYERLARPFRDLLVPLMHEARRENGLPDVDGNLAFISCCGAIATTVAARPFVERLGDQPRTDQEFRQAVALAAYSQVLPLAVTGGNAQ